MHRFSLLLIFLFAVATCKAQWILEHTYPGNFLSRIEHPSEGAVYFHYNDQTSMRTYLVFDSAHQLIQTTSLPAPNGMSHRGAYKLSADFFDNDPGVEILQFWAETSSSDMFGYLYDETGTVLAGPIEVDNPALIITFTTFANGSKQMLMGNLVYDAVSLQLLHTFSDILDSYPFVFKTETLDWKYAYLRQSGAFAILNPDFTVYQSHNFSTGASCDYAVIMAGQTVIEPDNDLEFVLVSSCPGSKTYKLFSGDDVLTTVTDANSDFSFVQVLLPDPLAGVLQPTLLVNKYFQNTSLLYKLPSGQLLTTVPEAVAAHTLNDGRILLGDLKQEAGPDSFFVYSPGGVKHSAFDRLFGGGLRLTDFSNATFDNDPATTEVAAIYDTNSKLKVQSDNGQVFLSVDSVGFASVSRLQGGSAKVFVSRPGLGQQGEMQVYGRSFQVSVDPDDVSNDTAISLWPNPVSSTLSIEFNNQDFQVDAMYICDPAGRVVWENGNRRHNGVEVVNVDQWPSGQYFLTAIYGEKSLRRFFVVLR